VGTQVSLTGQYNLGGLFSNGTTFSAPSGMDGGGGKRRICFCTPDFW
jgi:hypothetical protein